MPDAPHILIIEDHPAVRNMLVSVFQNSGYKVTDSPDGQIGLQNARQGGFAAILLDLKMPGMDGFEVLKNLKTLPPSIPNGPIIVFSSHAYDYAYKQATELGAAAFIQKDDLETIKIVDQVQEIINKHQGTLTA